eukprot:6179657-Pleurochrysis_carterae.AAC.1
MVAMAKEVRDEDQAQRVSSGVSLCRGGGVWSGGGSARGLGSVVTTARKTSKYITEAVEGLQVVRVCSREEGGNGVSGVEERLQATVRG